MNWNDYETLWKRQKLPAPETADLAKLKEQYETKRRRLAATLLVRDWIELVACGIGVFAYIRFWQQVGPSGWPMAFAILLILGVAGVFICERMRSRHNRLSSTASLLAKIESDLAEMHHRRRLLLRVWAWHILPCAVAILIHASVIVRRTRPWDPIREPFTLGLVGVGLALLCWLAWTVNRTAVRKQIEPRIAELERLHRDLTATNS